MGRKNLLNRIPFSVDLPAETIPGTPFLELAGESRIIIEHHLGVTSYSSSEICVRVKFGSVKILGGCLEIARMSKQQLVIIGRIDGITLLRR